MPEPLIRSISDTARWVAFHRASESERPDALFNDPFARRLAGERGELIARKLHQNQWAIAIRTLLFDTMLTELLARSPVDTIVNLAAGLDSRPYRLPLAAELRWKEFDLPAILDEKIDLLKSETPRCQLEVLRQDLSHNELRRAAFEQINSQTQCALVVTEGLLTYLKEEQVVMLSRDLLGEDHFRYWLIEVASPKVLEFVRRRFGKYLEEGNAPMHFAPADWRGFYTGLGWKVVEFRDFMTNALKYDRAPGMMKFFHNLGKLFPGWAAKNQRVWESGVALLERA
jgi:methyltransferase (TIGR00027 family)